jgi:hypothetical protein
MLMLAIISILIGATLGLRFKVLVLLPAIIIAGFAILVGGLAYSSSFSSIVAASAIAISGLQFGYLGGSMILRFATFSLGSGRAWPRPPAMSGPAR